MPNTTVTRSVTTKLAISILELVVLGVNYDVRPTWYVHCYPHRPSNGCADWSRMSMPLPCGD